MGSFRWGDATTDVNDGIEGGPLVLFNVEQDVLVISPFEEFMDSSLFQDHSARTVSWGPMGGIDHVQGGTSFATIMVYGSKGINDVGSVICPLFQTNILTDRPIKQLLFCFCFEKPKVGRIIFSFMYMYMYIYIIQF